MATGSDIQHVVSPLADPIQDLQVATHGDPVMEDELVEVLEPRSEVEAPVAERPWWRVMWRAWRKFILGMGLETRLLFAATLVFSLTLSSFTFWAISTVQQDAQLNDTRFGRDLGLLLSANVAPLVAEGEVNQVAQLTKQYYASTTSIRYILYADPNGQIYYGIPFSNQEVKTSLNLTRRIQLPDNRPPGEGDALVRTHVTPAGRVTDIFVGIYHEGHFLGTLGLGINPNPTQLKSSQLAREVSVGVFMAVWVLAILGGVLNAFTITRPIKDLVSGVKGIARGNFKQRITLQFGGEFAQLIDSFNDMAERLQSYEEQNIEEITAAKARLELLVSTIVDAAILLDSGLEILLANPAALRMFGWNYTTILRAGILNHLPEGLQIQLARPLRQMATGELDNAEFRFTLAEPTSRVVRINLSTVFDQRKQNVKGIVITAQDITREVELNEAKGQFISNISHELRTPLCNIKSFIEVLQEYGEQLDPKERQDYLDIANRETDRLTRLVNDVLDLSRLESGRQYRFESIDIAALVEHLMRNYQLHAKDKTISLKKFVDEPMPLVWGNYDLLLQVLTNLVGNALKFTPEGGQVSVHVHALQSGDGSLQSVRLSVADTGIGIAPEDHDRIFGRFERVENRVHTLEGTGLGLAIVRNILEKHHTEVHLESTLGQGSTFWFELNLYENEKAQVLDGDPVSHSESCQLQDKPIQVL